MPTPVAVSTPALKLLWGNTFLTPDLGLGFLEMGLEMKNVNLKHLVIPESRKIAKKDNSVTPLK